MKICYKIGPAICLPSHLTTSSLHTKLTQDRKRMGNKLTSAAAWPCHLLSLSPLWEAVQRALYWHQQSEGRYNFYREQVTNTPKNLALLLLSNLQFPPWNFRVPIHEELSLREGIKMDQGDHQLMEPLLED